MNENIDLTEILKDCPIGWKFYSSIYGDVTFYKIESDSHYPIVFSFADTQDIERSSSITKQGLVEFYCSGECTFFPSKDQRDWSKFTAPWYKKERFDPNTLQPFDRVLARDDDSTLWKPEFFSYIVKKEEDHYPYVCSSDSYKECIPYNNDTKHLVGTIEEAPEYYRYWED